tara:strand:+ start:1900 stop:2325 length:426 start_codon:yes stop_codon:yes gene_type:complete
MDLQKLSKKLKLFIDQQAEQMCLPIQHGNSLRIKNFVVRENSMGFLLYDIKNHKQVTTTFTKTAALAMARQMSQNKQDSLQYIGSTDDRIHHKYNECVFYKHTIARTDDDIKRESAKIRYDIAWEDLLKLRDTLDYYIFDK